MELIERVYDYCLKNKISLAEFALKAGVCKSTIYGLGKKKTNGFTATKILKVLENNEDE